MAIEVAALEAALRRGDLLVAAWAALHLAWPLAEQGEFERSARLLEAALGFIETAGATRDWMDAVSDAAVVNVLRQHLDASATQVLLDEGRNIPLEKVARDELDDHSGARPMAETPSTRRARQKQRLMESRIFMPRRGSL